MSHRIKSATPIDNFNVMVVFQNGIEKTYDMRKLYQMFPQFSVFETDVELFYNVMVDCGGYGISWNDELDLSAEEIWENGVEIGRAKNVDVVDELAFNLTETRNLLGITQKQLAEITGIYQEDISKIERGLANPTLSILKRLAEGLEVKLRIEFVVEEKSKTDEM